MKCVDSMVRLMGVNHELMLIGLASFGDVVLCESVFLLPLGDYRGF